MSKSVLNSKTLYLNLFIIICVYTSRVLTPQSQIFATHIFERPVQQTRNSESSVSKVYGFRVEGEPNEQWFNSHTGLTYIQHNSDINLRIFGQNLDTNAFQIGLTLIPPIEGKSICNPSSDARFIIDSQNLATINLPEEGRYFLCQTNGKTIGTADWIYIDDALSPHLQIESVGTWFPLWLLSMIAIILLLFSALVSGLSLGLMSLDLTDLRIIIGSGTEEERKFATKVLPIREKGNWLLCALLLSNVMVNALLTILIERIAHGLWAAICATVVIFIFGEVIPQAVCSKNALSIGARTIFLTECLMYVTSPVSCTIGCSLDKIVGKDLGSIVDRPRLLSLIIYSAEVNCLAKSSADRVAGALEFSQKKITNVFKQFDIAFKLPYDTIINLKTMETIFNKKCSRIPILKNGEVNCVLYVEDLANIGPNEEIKINDLHPYYRHPPFFVDENDPCSLVFNKMKKGFPHLAIVGKINSEGKHELKGIITLTDLIAQLIQNDFNDEIDIVNSEERPEFSQMLIKREKTKPIDQKKSKSSDSISSLRSKLNSSETPNVTTEEKPKSESTNHEPDKQGQKAASSRSGKKESV